MPAYLFAKKTEAEWAAVIFNFGREATEIGLKFISWSLLLSVIRLSRIKSGSAELLTGEAIVTTLLYMYMFYQVQRINIEIFPPENFQTKKRYRIITWLLNAAVTTPILVAGVCVSNAIIRGLVELQLAKSP